MYSSVDVIWTLLGTALVFFMQAGFAMVETGFTRAKNAGNIIMKNLMDFAIGTPVYWIFGFGIMFGATQFGIIGAPDFFVRSDYSVLNGLPTPVFVIFQTVFCATAATIVSGAMAERTKFLSYCLYSFAISAFVYPVSGHWIWGGGWLAQLGFHDFAGSTAVHMVGGLAALIGAKMIGPRIGKYDKNGNPRAVPGHSLTLGALGVFILWFCWFGFNGASTISATGDDILYKMGHIFMTTNMAAACASVTVMIATWLRYKKPDVSMTLNGSLAGLVAITAGCDTVSIAGSAIIGVLAGFVVMYGIEFVDKTLKIDDPVGAVGVHFCCGTFGTIAVGIFSTDGGLLYGGSSKLFVVQLIGVMAVMIWTAVMMTIIFNIIKHTIGLRVTEAEEIAGLDIEEHGIENSYADFMPMQVIVNNNESTPKTSIDVAVPVKHISTEGNMGEQTISKVVIIAKQSKFEELKNALNEIGITGMTVSNVIGCGMQKGSTEYYRGVEMDMTLLPKIKIEIVVSAVPVSLVVETAKSVLYTGKIGDGKIFIYHVENVIKVRTGEEGFYALQDD